MSRARGRTAALTLAALIVIATAIAYVAAPPQSVDGYRERAASTAETLVSQVETASLWVETEVDDKATTAATLVGLEEAEEDGRRAAAKFEGYEPPTEALALRRRFASLAAETNEVLSALRIAAEQERWEELPRLATPLHRLSDEWSRFEERAEP